MNQALGMETRMATGSLGNPFRTREAQPGLPSPAFSIYRQRIFKDGLGCSFDSFIDNLSTTLDNRCQVFPYTS